MRFLLTLGVAFATCAVSGVANAESAAVPSANRFAVTFGSTTSEVTSIRIEGAGVLHPTSAVRCTRPCTLYLTPGTYRLYLGSRTRGWSPLEYEIDGPGTLALTPPSAGVRTAGFGFAAVGGTVLVASLVTLGVAFAVGVAWLPNAYGGGGGEPPVDVRALARWGGIEAEEALSGARDPAIRSALERISRDEARHAELGFRFVRRERERSGDRPGRARRTVEGPRLSVA